jgi:hypothetical protein
VIIAIIDAENIRFFLDRNEKEEKSPGMPKRAASSGL